MYLPETTNDIILAAIKEMWPGKQECVMILLGEAHPQVNVPVLIQQLQALDIAFFGGIFPGLINGGRRFEHGVILKKFKCSLRPTLIRDLAAGELTEIDTMEIPRGADNSTSIILLDGLTTGINNFLERINNQLGDKVSFLGAGAGYSTLVQQPCIFTNAGLFQDAAVCCIIDQEIVLGVRHGWQHLAGPLVATRAEQNTIYELNWENAFGVYKEIVEENCGCTITPDNFLDIAKGYPLGILREGLEDIVRDPISVGPQGELVCIGEVPSNTVLHILRGDPDKLITSAGMVAEDCLSQLATTDLINHTLVVDCISRPLFLEGEFSRELQAIQDKLPAGHGEKLAQGVMSLGEISSYGAGTLELFNKTIVVGLMKE